jgi:hypothetical protein
MANLNYRKDGQKMANSKTSSHTITKGETQNRKKRTQRVEEFKKNFHAEFESGVALAEIAKKYDVDKSYAYKLLGGIAASNGVTRDYYMVRENTGYTVTSVNRKNSFTHYSDEDYNSIISSFDNCFSDIKILNQKIEAMKKERENNEDEER